MQEFTVPGESICRRDVLPIQISPGASTQDRVPGNVVLVIPQELGLL